MVPNDDDEGGGGPVIIDPNRSVNNDPNRSVNNDHQRADRLCMRIRAAIDLTEEPGGRDGYAELAAQRLEEAIILAKKHRESFQ